MSRKRPAANASQSPRQPATPVFVTLPKECLEKVLEYVYDCGDCHVEDIEIYLYVGEPSADGFAKELQESNVPADLPGRTLKNGNDALCSGQLPLVDREKCARKNLGIAQENLAHDSFRWLFREFCDVERDSIRLQARCFYIRHVDEQLKCWPELEDYWQGYWMTIGKVLEDPYPLAALDKCLNQSLCEVAPCNYRYVLCHNVLTFRTLAPSEANGLVACGRMCRMSWSCDEDYPKPYAEVQADDVFVCACPAAVRQHCVPRRCWDCFVRHCTIQPFHSISHHLRAPDVNLEWGA